jgi:hypothetical protein
MPATLASGQAVTGSALSMLTSGVAERCGQMSFAYPDQTKEDDIGFFFDKTKSEKILYLKPINLLWPIPAKGSKVLTRGKRAAPNRRTHLVEGARF